MSSLYLKSLILLYFELHNIFHRFDNGIFGQIQESTSIVIYDKKQKRDVKGFISKRLIFFSPYFHLEFFSHPPSQENRRPDSVALLLYTRVRHPRRLCDWSDDTKSDGNSKPLLQTPTNSPLKLVPLANSDSPFIFSLSLHALSRDIFDTSAERAPHKTRWKVQTDGI